MNFYEAWEDVRKNEGNDDSYFEKFLSKDEESLLVLHKGSILELKQFCNFILSIRISEFIEHINGIYEFEAKDIIQYSDLSKTLDSVCSVINFADNPLTFEDLGHKLIHAFKQGAQNKYGENHAKLAKELSMVELKKEKRIVVCNTSFGKESVRLSQDVKIDLLKRLIIRNQFIKHIINKAKNDEVYYMKDAMKVLSKTTAYRRKLNNKEVLQLVLSDEQEIYNNIKWS